MSCHFILFNFMSCHLMIATIIVKTIIIIPVFIITIITIPIFIIIIISYHAVPYRTISCQPFLKMSDHALPCHLISYNPHIVSLSYDIIFISYHVVSFSFPLTLRLSLPLPLSSVCHQHFSSSFMIYQHHLPCSLP